MQSFIVKPRLWIPLVLALAVFSPAPPAAAVEASPYGINIHAPQGEELNALLDRVQAAGIGWVRIDFIWAWVEPARDQYDWQVYDAIAAAARARGIEVFASIAYTPQWATSGAAVTGVPSDPAQWAEVCGAAAGRYRNTIRHWGVWNEPNLDKFWSGSRQQYVDVLLKPCADAIRAANPAAKVGGPDLAHLTSGDSDWYDWMLEILRDAGDRLDYLTHHVYDSDGHRDLGDRLDGSTVFGNRPSLWNVVNPSVEEVLREAGWGKPVWITETGWDTTAVSEAQQASWVGGLLNDWLGGVPDRSWIHKFFFYELADGPPPAPGWGFLRADRSAKPAWDTYRAFIASHTPQRDDAVPVDSTFPGTMEAGQPVVVRLTFRNTGTTAWTEASGYRLAAVDDVDPFTEPRQLLDAGESIGPNEEKTFVFEIVAPNVPGTYRIGWQMLREGGARFGTSLTKEIRVVNAPSVEQRTLRLMGDRFRVQVSWRDPGSGRAGFGRAVNGIDPTGYFWFFDSSNLELVVKALDGRALNQHYWLFYGALSNVEYWVDVTETRTGKTKRYHNAPGGLCGRGDTSAFPASAGNSAAAVDGAPLPLLPVEPPAELPFLEETGEEAAASCVADAQTLCLFGKRFRVSVEWWLQDGTNGRGTAVPGTDVSGTFWFFGPENVELVVKTLDGRALNNRFWFFYGALSDVRYTITVLDTVTGVRKRYRNPAGNLCGKGDTSAFVP